MAAVLLEYLADSREPISVDEVKANCKIVHDAEDSFIRDVVIPAARKLAEERAGAAIRPARYSDVLPSLARYPLSLGQVYEIEGVAVDGHDLDAAGYSLIRLGREVLIDAPGFAVSTATVTYKAGVSDMGREPAVKSWLLLAAGWFLRQRELFLVGQPLQEMPCSFVDGLLNSITQPPRF